MNKQNKAPQATKSGRMVDISQVFNPTGYAAYLGVSRQRVYDMIESKIIAPGNVYEKVGGSMIVHDDTDERLKPRERMKRVVKEKPAPETPPVVEPVVETPPVSPPKPAIDFDFSVLDGEEDEF